MRDLKSGIDRYKLSIKVLITTVALFSIGHEYGQMGISGILSIIGIALFWGLGIIRLSSFFRGSLKPDSFRS